MRPRKTQYGAVLRNVPLRPKDACLMVDMIRGQKLPKALGIPRGPLQQGVLPQSSIETLRTAIANWEQRKRAQRPHSP